eukprot:Awhi_evm1s11403
MSQFQLTNFESSLNLLNSEEGLTYLATVFSNDIDYSNKKLETNYTCSLTLQSPDYSHRKFNNNEYLLLESDILMPIANIQHLSLDNMSINIDQVTLDIVQKNTVLFPKEITFQTATYLPLRLKRPKKK